MLPIDFTQMQRRKKAYAGANGNKIAVVYEGEQYMLKFPSAPRQNPDMSYSNSCFFDCESCLYPQADERIMNLVLQREDERNYRIYEIPTSAILIGGKKIKYFDFLTSLQNEGCNMALKRIVPRIDLEKINALIEETPFLSDLQKIFYKTMLRERKIKILDFALNSLEKRGANV